VGMRAAVSIGIVSHLYVGIGRPPQPNGLRRL
jgi:hypothetical protein